MDTPIRRGCHAHRHGLHGQRHGLLELLRTTDHKTLGLMYLVMTFRYRFAS
jgi:hypothetical protein